jgi:hypothetical protein
LPPAWATDSPAWAAIADVVAIASGVVIPGVWSVEIDY